MAFELTKEEEYFARQDFDRKKKLIDEKRAKFDEAEKKRRQELHYMHCPKCGSKLIDIKLHGVEIDTCNDCKGMWLDAGELEIILKSKDSSILSWVSSFVK